MNKISVLKTWLLASVLTLTFSPFTQSQNADLQKLELTYQIISTFYVDTVNTSKLTDEAITGMLKGLDPHSSYLSKDEVKEMNEPINGSFEGVGIQFDILFDTLLVVQAIPGGPCEKVGIKAGDRIIQVDGKNIAKIKLKNSDVLKLLKGPKGTVVSLAVKRKNEPALKHFKVTRDKIPIYSVDAAYMAAPQIGYIKMNMFAMTTYSEFLAALNKLQKQGLQSLIIDLRGNGGGVMKAATDIADEFIGNRQEIVYTQGVKSAKQVYWGTSMGNFEKGNVVVLMDEGSASASEILAGAIQDWDRGVVIGRRSFGKGLVQRPYDLPDGSMLRLTIAKYYTPSGRCIQKPYVDGKDDYDMELYDRYKKGELMNVDSVKINQSDLHLTLKNKRKVYGGGGIMPDVFIPIDTTLYSDYYNDMVAKGVINDFVSLYVDDNRAQLMQQYPQFQLFKNNFEVDKILLDKLIALGDKEKVAFVEQQFILSKSLFKTQLKALIARGLFTTSEYFQITNPEINVYQEAIKILQSPNRYNNLLK